MNLPVLPLRCIPAACRWIGLALILVSGLAPARVTLAAGVQAILSPPTSTVSPGAEFDILIQIPQAGASFNAFDAVFGYDPAVLTLVPLAPLSLQEGSLMTSACANRFHRFRQGADRDTVTLALLCGGVSVAGPGAIYRVRFRASNTPQTTTVRLVSAHFFAAGIAVGPVTTADATVGIGVIVGVGDPPAAGPSIQAWPNPFRSSTVITLRSTGPNPSLLVSDLQGRIVRRLQEARRQADRHRFEWDGTDDAGVRVRAGVYFLRDGTPGSSVRARIIRIE